MKRLLCCLVFVLSFSLWGASQFSPTTMTSETAPTPFVASESSYYVTTGQSGYLAFESLLTNPNFWLGCGTVAGDFAPHVMSSASAPSPYVISSSTQFFANWNAFADCRNEDCGGSGTDWLGSGGGTDWLQIDLGSGNAQVLKSYIIRVNGVPEPTRAPKNWTMQGSNDGSTWTTLDTQSSQSSWGSCESRLFNGLSNTTAYRYYRLNITANNGDGTYTQVEELFLSSVNLSSNVTTGVDWVELDVGAGNAYNLTQYIVSVNSVPQATRAPKNWTIQASNDNSTWTTLDTQTNQTSWTSGQARTFNVTTTGTYRYWRMSVTANNGDMLTQVAYLQLIGNGLAGTCPQKGFGYVTKLREIPRSFDPAAQSHQVEVDQGCYASHRHRLDRSQRQRGCKAA